MTPLSTPQVLMYKSPQRTGLEMSTSRFLLMVELDSEMVLHSDSIAALTQKIERGPGVSTPCIRGRKRLIP